MPEVMNIFEPLTTYSPPSRRALVSRPATSEPPEGSVIASALIFSPDRISGSTRRFSASLPKRRIGGAPMPCDSRLAIRPPLPALVSSSSATRW